ncbi:hypothetical protein C8F01DRAFT_1235138 [Mycena amicta]|nr:hypothetical protein C8F01DRAFT_1235138 [Mycena amicta]
MPEAIEAFAAAYVAQRGLEDAISKGKDKGEDLQVQSIAFDPTGTECLELKYGPTTVDALPVTFKPSFKAVMRGNTNSPMDLFYPLRTAAPKVGKPTAKKKRVQTRSTRSTCAKRRSTRSTRAKRRGSNSDSSDSESESESEPESESSESESTSDSEGKSNLDCEVELAEGNKEGDLPTGAHVPISVTSLRLHGFHPHLRGIILNLGKIYLGINYLTHTTVQWFSKTQWDDAICLIPCTMRGFRIGIAFVFKTCVFAFVSNDNVFQPNWGRSLTGFQLPPSPLDAQDAWLSSALKWIEEMLSSRSQALAAEIIRKNKTVWEGAGVYTVSEIFYRAGIRGSLTIRELVRCISATARLICAFYTHLKQGAAHARHIVSASTVEGVMAPNDGQKTAWGHYLNVYGKEHTMVSARVAETLASFAADFDAFEPSLIDSEILARFAPAIFGKSEAKRLGFTTTSSICSALFALYQKKEISPETPTKLRTDIYDVLTLSSQQLRARRAGVTAHRIGTAKRAKQFWTVYQEASQKRLPQLEGYHRFLFLHLSIYTSGEAIGPLEYCSNGYPLTFGATTRAMVCVADPRFGDHYHKLRHVSEKRASIINEHNHGRRKRGWKDDEESRRDKDLPEILTAARAGRKVLEQRSAASKKENARLASDELPRVVKRRKGADAAIREQFKSLSNIL